MPGVLQSRPAFCVFIVIAKPPYVCVNMFNAKGGCGYLQNTLRFRQITTPALNNILV